MCQCQHQSWTASRPQTSYPLYMQDRGDTVGMQTVKASLRRDYDDRKLTSLARELFDGLPKFVACYDGRLILVD